MPLEDVAGPGDAEVYAMAGFNREIVQIASRFG
jgi:hypothetical protein